MRGCIVHGLRFFHRFFFFFFTSPLPYSGFRHLSFLPLHPERKTQFSSLRHSVFLRRVQISRTISSSRVDKHSGKKFENAYSAVWYAARARISIRKVFWRKVLLQYFFFSHASSIIHRVQWGGGGRRKEIFLLNVCRIFDNLTSRKKLASFSFYLILPLTVFFQPPVFFVTQEYSLQRSFFPIYGTSFFSTFISAYFEVFFSHWVFLQLKTFQQACFSFRRNFKECTSYPLNEHLHTGNRSVKFLFLWSFT